MQNKMNLVTYLDTSQLPTALVTKNDEKSKQKKAEKRRPTFKVMAR